MSAARKLTDRQICAWWRAYATAEDPEGADRDFSIAALRRQFGGFAEAVERVRVALEAPEIHDVDATDVDNAYDYGEAHGMFGDIGVMLDAVAWGLAGADPAKLPRGYEADRRRAA